VAKVQYFGREIDPGNELYQAFKARDHRPRGARLAPPRASTRSPRTGCNAPMDFENEVLANDLRKSLLAGAASPSGPAAQPDAGAAQRRDVHVA
jgi:hypothetical protein